jgi:hypothetical protein
LDHFIIILEDIKNRFKPLNIRQMKSTMTSKSIVKVARVGDLDVKMPRMA